MITLLTVTACVILVSVFFAVGGKTSHIATKMNNKASVAF